MDDLAWPGLPAALACLPAAGGELGAPAGFPPATGDGDFAQTLARVGGGQSPLAATPSPDPAAGPAATADVPIRARPRRRDDVAQAVPEAVDPNDPWARHAAHLAPPATVTPAPPTPLQAQVPLEELLPALVRRVAWSGDGRRAAVRLELGAGALAGAELLVTSEGGSVRVALRAPAGTDVAGWRERVASRLARRGLAVEGVDVE